MNTAAAIVVFGHTIPQELTLDEGKPPSWLLSSYESLEWRLDDIGDQRTRTIHWDLALGVHGRLPDYKHLLETVKRVVYGLRTGPHATLKSGAQQYNCAQAFFCLIRWMLDRGRLHFSEITRRDIDEYKAGCAKGVNYLLDSKTKLQQLVESMVLAAGFAEGETKEERVAKSLLVFPYRTNNRRQVRLDRDAMLDGAGLNSRSPHLSGILDALEHDCGFYLDSAQRRRLERSVQAGSQAEAELDDEDEDEDDLVEEEVDKPALDAITKDRARMLLAPLSQLYIHRRSLADTVRFHPFAQLPLRKVLNSLTLNNIRRTRTAPVKQTITFIERAARWVLDYSRPLLALQKWATMHEHEPTWTLQKMVVSRARRLSGPAAPVRIVHRGRDVTNDSAVNVTASAVALRAGMSLRTALTFLQTACVVVIAAFTARRAAEIRSLRAGCIELDDMGKPWLRVFIHKTVQDWTLIPVPALVVKAVKVLERLSASARNKSGTDLLLQVVIPGADEVVGINGHGEPVVKLATNIEKFGYFVDVPEMDDGTRWAFAPHQFRRFFAVMYIWAYEYGDIDALSYHLRHWNREQTRRYCTEDQVGREVTSANRERAAEVLSSAALGTLKFDGHPRLTKAVERLCHRMARKVQVVSRRQLEARTRRLMDRANVSLHAFPWGYCVTTHDGRESATHCNREGTQAKPDQASIATCTGCPKVMRSPAHRVFLVGALKTHKELAGDTAGVVPMVRQASAAMVELIEQAVEEVA